MLEITNRQPFLDYRIHECFAFAAVAILF